MSKQKQPSIMNKDTEKTTVTISKDTKDWLTSEYPDALSLQEAIRTALSDARVHREVVSGSQVNLSQKK